MVSTAHTGEKAVAGTVAGLIDLHETVTWRAKHLGVWQELTSVITEVEAPHYFVDELQKGAFKHFRHEHRLQYEDGRTHMTDVFDYTSPFGFLGKFVDWLFLKHYMTQLLIKRNESIKEFAESDRWKDVLFVEKVRLPEI